MVTVVPAFTTCNESNLGTAADVAGKINFCFSSLSYNLSFIYSAHINHVRNIAGIDSVGLGADYDGIDTYVFHFFLLYILYAYFELF